MPDRPRWPAIVGSPRPGSRDTRTCARWGCSASVRSRRVAASGRSGGRSSRFGPCAAGGVGTTCPTRRGQAVGASAVASEGFQGHVGAGNAMRCRMNRAPLLPLVAHVRGVSRCHLVPPFVRLSRPHVRLSPPERRRVSGRVLSVLDDPHPPRPSPRRAMNDRDPDSHTTEQRTVSRGNSARGRTATGRWVVVTTTAAPGRVVGVGLHPRPGGGDRCATARSTAPKAWTLTGVGHVGDAWHRATHSTPSPRPEARRGAEWFRGSQWFPSGSRTHLCEWFRGSPPIGEPHTTQDSATYSPSRNGPTDRCNFARFGPSLTVT